MNNTKRGIDPKELVGNKKLCFHNLPWAGILALIKSLDDGSIKYAPLNWREEGGAVKELTYINAILRHVLAMLDGEDCARDSGVPHEVSIAACALIISDGRCHGNLVDDRHHNMKGVLSAMMEDHDLGRDIGHGPPQSRLGTKDLDFCITEDKDDLLNI